MRFQAIRGMNDILPEQVHLWRKAEAIIEQILTSYGYNEIRLPIVEKTELFKRATGEITDIVEKEMYSFIDRNGDDISLRPEGTPVCVRAGIEHGLFYNQEQRWWYYGPMFRHERPQKGRYRQFHQIGVEVFGLSAAAIDVELILLSARLWQVLGIEHMLVLQLNSLGTPKIRKAYRETLVAYLKQHTAELDEDSKRRIETNPLRILDSKNPAIQMIIQGAPKLLNQLDAESKGRFTSITDLLDAQGIKYQINPCLVRGLDYYNHTVFEWLSPHLGAQATVCAGGRYDNLVEHLGGHATPAIGFALGMERLIALLEQSGNLVQVTRLDIYLVLLGAEVKKIGLLLAEKLRDALPKLKIYTHCGDGNIKSQLKRADKSGARLALILGEEEAKTQTIAVKFLREDKSQQPIALQQLVNFLQTLFE